MPRSVRTSRSGRSSQHNILNFSSDLEQSTRRDSKWWRNLSDRSVCRSLIRNVRLHENENATLSDGSYPCEDVNSQWWRELNENESTIFQRNAFKDRNRSNSVVEEDDKTAHESHAEHNAENVVRKMIFTGSQPRSGNHRFSKAFHVEQTQINESQAETDKYDSGETNNEKNKNAETDAPTGESSKRKMKRKTVQLFSRKPYSQRFSEAFHSVEEDKIESEQQDKSKFQSQRDNEEQHSEIIVPATQQSQETRRTSQVVGVCQDTLSNIEEDIEVNETLAKNKTNLETTTQKKNLFSNIPETKRTFSEAFLKTAVDETCVGTKEERETTEKVTVNDDTIDTELNQSVEIRKGLFIQKQTQRRKFSEAFSKPKHTDDSVDKSNQQLAERASKSFRKSHIKESEQIKHFNKVSEDVLSNEQTENIGAVRKSTRISKNNDTNQMDVSKNIQIKPSLFQGNKRDTRKFSDAFSDTQKLETCSGQLSNQQEESNIVGEHSRMTRKSTRISKQINETNPMEMSENVQSKNLFNTVGKKESRKFSDAFAKSRITVHEIESDDNLSENEAVEKESARRSIKSSKKTSESVPNESDTNNSARKSLRLSKIIESVQTKQNLFKTKLAENRKFSDAFAKSTVTEHDEVETHDNLRENEIIERESIERSTRRSRQKSELQTKSIPDEIDDNVPVRESLRLSKINETKQMEISENVQTKQDLFKAKVKETRKFSAAFTETKIIEKSLDEKELSDNQGNNNILSENSKMSERKPTRKSENNTINHTDTSDILQAKKDLFRNKIKESRKFSEAFAETSFKENLDNKTTEYQETKRNKSTVENKTDPANESSHLSTLPSINDTVHVDKKVLFKPKARKSLFSLGNTPSRLKKIDENAAVETEPYPQSSPAESVDQNVVFSDSVISKFFETSFISSTKLIINPNMTRRNSTDDSQVEENQNENKIESQNRRSLRGSHIPSQRTSMQTENIERPDQESSRKNIDESEAQINKDTSQNNSSNTAQQEISKQKETDRESHQKKHIDDDEEEEKNRNKPRSKTRSTNVVPQEILIPAEQTEKPENANTECDAPTGVVSKIVNKGVSKIPVLHTSSKKIRKSKTLETVKNQSELTNNESNVQSSGAHVKWNKTTTEYEDINAVENFETRTSLKNISKRTTILNEDNAQESQISRSLGKRSSIFIADDIQTHISNNKSSRVSTTAESTDKTTEEKPETRTSSHKNTSKFNLNDMEKNVTYNKSNRISMIKTPVNDKKLQMQKEVLLKVLNEVNPKTSQITAQQLPSKKITDFFSKINYSAIPKMTNNKITKSKPKPIPSALLVNGKRYKPEKLYKGAQWCNKRFYKYLQKKLQNKYGEKTIVESENLMKFIVNSAKIILKSKQHPADEITKLKMELARHNVISTTFEFFGFVADYLPYDIRDKIVPYTRAHYSTPTVPYDREGVFKPIEF